MCFRRLLSLGLPLPYLSSILYDFASLCSFVVVVVFFVFVFVSVLVLVVVLLLILIVVVAVVSAGPPLS